MASDKWDKTFELEDEFPGTRRAKVDYPKQGAAVSDTRKNLSRNIHVEASAIEQLLASVPTSSSYYLDVGYPPPPPPPPQGLNASERRVASTMFDVHSRICAWRLLAAWRSRELIDAALRALDEDKLVIATALVRPLLENAAALDVESMQLAKTWPLEGARVLRREDVALQWRADASRILKQALWGTRQKKLRDTHPERTNILTLIGKASKHTGEPDLLSVYERLCDVVHPSLGANSVYYPGSGPQGGFSDLIYVELASGATDFDDLRPFLADAWTWSLQTTGKGLRRLARISDCLCMAAKLYAYGDLGYWGIVRPSGEYDLCPCGSGLKLHFCDHVIPDDVIGGPGARSS